MRTGVRGQTGGRPGGGPGGAPAVPSVGGVTGGGDRNMDRKGGAEPHFWNFIDEYIPGAIGHLGNRLDSF